MITVAQAFEEAANKIDECGWIQGDFGTCETGYCLAGALHEVTNWVPGKEFLSEEELFARDQAYHAAIRYAEGVLRARATPPYSIALSRWNDAEGRTKDEATALLRECARTYQEATDGQ